MTGLRGQIKFATAEDKRYNIDKWAKLFKAKTWEEIKMLAKQDITDLKQEISKLKAQLASQK